MRVLQLKEDSVASAEGVVSIMADKSLVGRASWGKRVEMATVSHPVIASVADSAAERERKATSSEQRAISRIPRCHLVSGDGGQEPVSWKASYKA